MPPFYKALYASQNSHSDYHSVTQLQIAIVIRLLQAGLSRSRITMEEPEQEPGSQAPTFASSWQLPKLSKKGVTLLEIIANKSIIWLKEE